MAGAPSPETRTDTENPVLAAFRKHIQPEAIVIQATDRRQVPALAASSGERRPQGARHGAPGQEWRIVTRSR